MQPFTSEANVVNATPQTCLRHRYRDLSRSRRHAAGDCLYRGAGEICFSNPEDTRSGTPTCYLKYNFERVFIKSWSTSGDADDRPTEEVAFYYNKIAFGQQSEVP
jgi:hypothetical protein